ncbi:hypothetical protein GKZ90_0001195 [Flavobacterium sp. MC2016-06]|jgi:hypothetical protein|uniref:hypothetical protein n=1 Tax=Flavobacterium sp. MC2016-06 TaxID=2676308 RepID=UPI0012BA748C|nr:hypothetical protein [Flavobacterium sp. MC2016-06]MBU3859073.1 hypothetical protein [Flavobacterium sp. MC2016-06]
MTAILSWFNKEKGTLPYIMTVGDTKISNGEDTLTLEGAKILELPIRCKDLSTPYQEVYFTSSLSFSYAGSALVGFNVYCALQTMFSNIGGLKKYNQLPDYVSLCEKAKDVLFFYSTGIRSPSELVLSGFCPKSEVPFITTIKPVLKDDVLDYNIFCKTDFSDLVDVIIIGDKKTEILEEIDVQLSNQNKDDSTKYWRTPIKVLNRIIKEKQFATIGGGMQMTTVNLFRFETYSFFADIEGRDFAMKYRNIDIFEDLGNNLGDCRISITCLEV